MHVLQTEGILKMLEDKRGLFQGPRVCTLERLRGDNSAGGGTRRMGVGVVMGGVSSPATVQKEPFFNQFINPFRQCSLFRNAN